VEIWVLRPVTQTKIHQKFSVIDTQMRFSPLEGPWIRPYLLLFDDSSAVNRLGDMEHQRTKYELFLTKPILVKWLWHICSKMNLQLVFTELHGSGGRMRGIKEYVGKNLIKPRRPFW
jgi:hypothetical protein